MRFPPLWIGSVFAAFVCIVALCQTPPVKETSVSEAKGIPPRTSPADYQAQAKAGDVTIAADFDGHSVPKPEGPLSTEDYVVVEAALFGVDGQKLMLSIDDFTLRVNGKKTALTSTPFGLVGRTLKDPQWSPPEEAEPKQKSKGGLSTGGGADSSTPAIVHVPFELRRAMALYIEKTALPQGERPLPQAGLLFFRFFGKTQSIHSMELIYAGPAGKASLELQP